MNDLATLQPQNVWKYFNEICKIPRPSKKEDKIRKYLLDFSKKYKLTAKTDAVGNILISKPATKGFEKRKKVVLQSHVDMVCEKNRDTIHDFDNDPIIPMVDGNWVKAKGTTLGADDGIGVAAQLAILSADNIQHGDIECLFTVDEESGMTGAHGLQPGFLDGNIVINLDSEDEGELFIGCAGGIDTVGSFSFDKQDAKGTIFEIAVQNLVGGHSGDNIDKGQGNAIKIANRFLWMAMRKFDAGLVLFEGGNKRNAIPREAFATIVVSDEKAERLEQMFETLRKGIENEYRTTEPEMKLRLTKIGAGQTVKIIERKVQEKLLNCIYACPHGVVEMSREIKNLVETSTNLASIRFSNKNIRIETSQRSSVETAKKDIASMVESVFMLGGAFVEHGTGYPGWRPNKDSEILHVTEQSYNHLFNQKPIVRAIHAGLECGLFLEKYPNLDMISFGPTIRGAHSPEEKIDIETTQKFWDLLLDVLKNIPSK